MNPIYRFFLSADDGTSQRAYPIYGNNLAKEFAKESGEEFFRATLSGALVFEGPDYDYIFGKPFETIFGIEIKISYDAVNFSSYWKGKFFKINCDFDLDAKTISVKPEVDDDYVAVLAGMDKEYNLIELAPEITPINAKKRPCLQIYDPGKDTIGFLMFGNGLYWESPCTEESNMADLYNTYHFGSMPDWYPILLQFHNTWGPIEREERLFSRDVVGMHSTIDYGDYIMEWERVETPGEADTYNITLTRKSDNAQWSVSGAESYSLAVLEAVPDTGADWDEVDFSALASLNLFGRIIGDVDDLSYDIATNDIVENNRNYHKCDRYDGQDHPDMIILSGRYSETPTPYGIYQPGLYFAAPDDAHTWVPIARSSWSSYSIWLDLEEFLQEKSYDTDYSKDYVLKDAYPLASAISKILGKIAPTITHAATSDYSEFLYDTNPLTETDYRLVIVPKSNILKGEYDQPAQKAPITLRQITDMLRDCFRCYWFIEDKKFKIEHIEYFNGGGEYGGDPDYDVDLTTMAVSRSGKKWDFAKNSYSYDDADIPSRMEFGWMDDVTSPFEGDPIDMLSKYAKNGSVEKINIQNFTSDFDYMLLNPSACSDDGFGLLGVVEEGSDWVLPLVADGDADYQNGYMGFWYLQQYYFYDMPCRDFEIGGSVLEAYGVKRLRMQDISFPCYEDVDLQKLVKTNLGQGKYEKLSINLSSRMGKATLRYGTEQ